MELTEPRDAKAAEAMCLGQMTKASLGGMDGWLKQDDVFCRTKDTIKEKDRIQSAKEALVTVILYTVQRYLVRVTLIR